jgi:uncharacterized protein YraI
MSRMFLFYTFVSIIFFSTLSLISGNNQLKGLSNVPNQTIPTRTPTPEPTSPPPNPTKPNNDDDDDPTAVPTSTTEAQATATATALVTQVYTPVAEFLPTAEPCSDNPTVQALNPTNVRQGPGTDYPIVDKLVYLEVRYIQGRAADSSWWLIGLDNGETGWVTDNVVAVHGYIGNVPIIPSPAINGETPTPGVPWDPTSQPICPVTPTTSSTATPLASTTPEATQTETTENANENPQGNSEPQGSLTATVPVLQTATSTPQPTQTAVSPPTLMPTNQPQIIEGDSNEASPLADSKRSTTDFILPLSGILLIAAIIFTFIKKRRNGM